MDGPDLCDLASKAGSRQPGGPSSIYGICWNFPAAQASKRTGPGAGTQGGHYGDRGEEARADPTSSAGVAAAELTGGAMLTGHVGDDEVLLVRQGGKLFALSAYCTHYHGPLADGLLVGETIRCPWHHAHFNLQTGEAVAAPALAPVTCWAGRREVTARFSSKTRRRNPLPTRPAAGERFIIIGGGAAGFAAAEMLRRRGFAGSIIDAQQR